MALVYVAILMVVFCGFLGLAIDVGYMYLSRAQLQSAADSAALAGAMKLVGGGGTIQGAARTEAVSFAVKNDVDKEALEILSDNSNTLSAVNDVTVGNWNKATRVYQAGVTPVNAVQVKARRTGEGDAGGASPGGAIELFFAQTIAPKWAQMGASAGAIAQRSPKAGFYFMLGNAVCGTTGTQFLSPADANMAWTSLLEISTNANDLNDDLVCPEDKVPNVDVCGENVFTTNGIADVVFKAVEIDFYDPEYDRINKKHGADGAVTEWSIIVPVSVANDPTTQSSPQPVWGYGRVTITRACGKGVGNACPGRTAESTAACKGQLTGIEISSVSCVKCENSGTMIGARPSLVQ